LHQPDHFPSPDNAWVPGARWQTMRWQGLPLGLKFEDRGAVDRPVIRLSVWAEESLNPAFLDGLIAEITYRCNLDLDLSDFYARFADDAQLGPVIARWRGMRPSAYSSLYEFLLIAIVLQNATVRRSVQMMQALLETYGTALAYDGQLLYCFWDPYALDGVTEDDLRRLKVGYRARTIRRVTDAFVGGATSSTSAMDEMALRQAPLETQRTSLLALYGVGPASVGYILGAMFHRWGGLSHISPWEQRIYSKLFLDRDPDDPAPVEELLHLLDARFGEWKAVLQKAGQVS
jgi:3-methyladenine DNA glycosylase/8-oxoguanine DNA glycosylase